MMKNAPRKVLAFVACLGLVAAMSGCATNTGCGGGFSLFQNNPFKDRPVRNSIRSWFQGDACSTCNPPAGLPANCGSNVAPLCDNCATQQGLGGQQVTLYGGTNLNGPESGIPNPAPIYTEDGTVTNGVVGEIQSGVYGADIVNGGVNPPNF